SDKRSAPMSGIRTSPRQTIIAALSISLAGVAIPRAAHGQNATLTMPNGLPVNGNAQMSVLGSRGPEPIMYAQNYASGDPKVLQFVESGCAGQTYGVWGVTYSPDGTGVVGIAGSDAGVCSGAGSSGSGIGVKGISAYNGGYGVYGRNDSTDSAGVFGE